MTDNLMRGRRATVRLVGVLFLLFATLLSACGGSVKAPKPTPTRLPTATPHPAAQVVFAGDDNGDVFALSAATGAQEWMVPLGGGLITDLVVNQVAQGQGYLYVVTSFGGVYALSIQDGSVIWRFAPPAGASLLLSGEVACADDAQGLYLLDALSGDEAKFLPYPNTHLLTVAHNVVYFTSTQNKLDIHLVAVSLVTATQLWQVTLTGDYSAQSDVTINQGVEDAGRLYVGTSLGHLLALNEQTGAVVWDAPNNEQMNTLSVQGDTLYVGGGNQSASGHVYAYDAVNGKLMWKAPVAGEPFAFQAADPTALYVGTNDYASSGYIYAISPSTGATFWRSTSIGAIKFVPDEQIWVAAGALYVGAVGAVDAFQAANGQPIWSFTLPEGGATNSTAIA